MNKWSGEWTKREIFFSIIFITILIGIGTLISSSINHNITVRNEKYYKALKVTSDDMFVHACETNIGNILAYGDVVAKDAVTMPEINGRFAYIEKVKEKYTMHTRQVAHTSGTGKNKHTYYTTETYYTWDVVNREAVQCNSVGFLGLEIPSSSINLRGSSVLSLDGVYAGSYRVSSVYAYETSRTRYLYYVVPTTTTGTLECNATNNKLNNIHVTYDTTIQEFIDMLDSKKTICLVIFWIIWLLIIGGATVAFYNLDNDWLNK